MRAYEEILEQNYENITYGELCEYEIECEHCPLSIDGWCNCNGGMKCYGGMPIEPPCCSFDNDDILQEISNKWLVESIKMKNY